MEKQPVLIQVPAAKDSHRWVAVTALLLAIGIILHTISPNIGGVTPNWTIAMYSITISLTNPSLSRAIGIGFVAGLTIVPSSKSAFPLGNICKTRAAIKLHTLLNLQAVFLDLSHKHNRPAYCLTGFRTLSFCPMGTRRKRGY